MVRKRHCPRRPVDLSSCSAAGPEPGMLSPVETGRLHFSELPDASSRGIRRIERRRRFPFGSSAISHLTNPHSAANRTFSTSDCAATSLRGEPTGRPVERGTDLLRAERSDARPRASEGGLPVAPRSDPSAVRPRTPIRSPRLHRKEGCPEGSPPTATRAQDRGRSLDAIALLWPVRNWPSFPGPPTHSTAVEQ